MTKLYTHPGIAQRKDRQRYDKPLIPFAGPGLRGLPADCTVVATGYDFIGRNGEGQAQPYYTFEVTLANGVVVPCYSGTKGLGSDGYVIVQHFGFKAHFPKGVAK